MIDVIVTSICRKQFEATHASFIKNIKYDRGFRFIMHIDVLEKNKHYLPRLLEYLKCNGIKDVNINTGRHSFANALNYLFKRVETEYYFHLEDDWVFLKSLDLNIIIPVMKNNGNIHHIRFSKEQIKEPSHKMKEYLYKRNELYLIPGEQINIDGIDLIKSSIWSLNPHIARASIVKQFVDIPIDINPENFLFKRYIDMFNPPRLYIYGKYGDSPYIRDVGRSSYLVRKAKTMIEIMRHPSLIKRENRIKRIETYIGKPFKY